ncbi:MAG: hypothetical protein ACLGI6_12485 [Gammaproteobacteria bacterium]
MRRIERVDCQLKLLIGVVLLMASSTALGAWMLGQYNELSASAGQALGRGSGVHWRNQTALFNQLAWAGMAVNAAMAAFVWHALRRAMAQPFEEAATVLERIGAGDLGAPIAIAPGASTQAMAQALQSARERLAGAIVRLRSGAESIGDIAAGLAQAGSVRALRTAPDSDHAATVAGALLSSAQAYATQARLASVLMMGATEAAASSMTARSADESALAEGLLWDKVQRASHAVHELAQQSEAHHAAVMQSTQLITTTHERATRQSILIADASAGNASIRDQVAGLHRVLAGFVLGAEDGQRAQIHLVSSNARVPARTAGTAPRPRMAAVRTHQDAKEGMSHDINQDMSQGPLQGPSQGGHPKAQERRATDDLSRQN